MDVHELIKEVRQKAVVIGGNTYVPLSVVEELAESKAAQKAEDAPLPIRTMDQARVAAKAALTTQSPS